MRKMTMHARREYLIQLKNRYLKANKTQKGQYLDEAIKTTGMNRNYIIEQLKPAVDLIGKTKRIRKSRKPIYDNEMVYYLKTIWDVLDCPCGQRMVGSLPQTMDALIRHGEITISADMEARLCTVSAPTIDRRLARFKKGRFRRLHGSTKPGSLLKRQIPIELSRWDERELGHSEIDLVVHNGGDPAGLFANTLVDTDLASGWTEQEAFLGKSEKRVIFALAAIDERRPFARKSIDSDNGSEFINWELWRHCKETDVRFTRGRPGKKNDNAHVEQKNWTHVRQLVGYRRYDTQQLVDLINDLYRNDWRLYENFFQATVKLTEKKRVGGHLQRKYAKAKTPYQRIMESEDVDDAMKARLEKQFRAINPAAMKRRIEQKLDVITQTAKVAQPAPSRETLEKRRARMPVQRAQVPETILMPWSATNATAPAPAARASF